MHELSKLAVQRLLGAGWHPNRRLDTTRYERLYKEYGQPYSQAVLDFLSEFGDLLVTFPHPRMPDSLTGFEIDPAGNLENLTFEKVEFYKTKYIGEAFCVVGLRTNSGDTLVMRMDGALYSIFDTYVALVGRDIGEAMENLCHYRILQRILP
jgi:hypothetical protein